MGRRALYITLFVSLALNLFVLGALAGVWWADRDRPHGPGPGPEMRLHGPIGAAVRTLTPEQQAAWRDGGGAFARENGARLREARRMRREALQGLGADPVDREAALAALARARAVEAEARAAMDGRLVEFAAALPAKDRAPFAEALATPPLREGSGRRGPGERLALPDR